MAYLLEKLTFDKIALVVDKSFRNIVDTKQGGILSKCQLSVSYVVLTSMAIATHIAQHVNKMTKYYRMTGRSAVNTKTIDGRRNKECQV